MLQVAPLQRSMSDLQSSKVFGLSPLQLPRCCCLSLCIAHVIVLPDPPTLLYLSRLGICYPAYEMISPLTL